MSKYKLPPIVVVEADRPKSGKEPPLPGYHDLLGYLCDQLGIPGSPTFYQAVAYIKEKLAASKDDPIVKAAMSLWKAENNIRSLHENPPAVDFPTYRCMYWDAENSVTAAQGQLREACAARDKSQR